MTHKLKERGRAILEDTRRDLRGEAVIDGVQPRRGMYLVNHSRRRVYGRIVRVRRSGVVVWESLIGIGSVAQPLGNGTTLKIETSADRLHYGASYSDDVPDGYTVLEDDGFRIDQEKPCGFGPTQSKAGSSSSGRASTHPNPNKENNMTKTPTVDMVAAEQAAAGEVKTASQYLTHIQKMEITSDPELHFAIGVAAEIKEKHTAVDAERCGFIEDAKSIIDRANAFFQPALQSLAECETVIKAKAVEFDARQNDRRTELILEAGEAGMGGDPVEATALMKQADAHLVAKVPGLSFRRSVSVEMINPEAAIKWCIENNRLELLQLNEKAVKALAKTITNGSLDLIPGVHVIPSATAAITVSKVERV